MYQMEVPMYQIGGPYPLTVWAEAFDAAFSKLFVPLVALQFVFFRCYLFDC